MKLKVNLLNEYATLPEYQSQGAAGFDLVATENVQLYPGETKLIPTGLAFEIPEGYELQIRPRSGLSYKTSLIVKNSPGTIDSDYRGEVKVILHNLARGHLSSTIEIKKGERIAQAVLTPVIKAEFEVVNELSNTNRSTGGFGSTGK